MHKATRVSLDNVAVNEIYHLCISMRFRRSQHDVKVERGADVSSDHHPLIAKLKLKLKKIWKEILTNRKRYNVSLTMDVVTQEYYKINLINRFNVLPDLQEEDTHIHDMWQR